MHLTTLTSIFVVTLTNHMVILTNQFLQCRNQNLNEKIKSKDKPLSSSFGSIHHDIWHLLLKNILICPGTKI